ncbi:hypothetical protein [Bdellovibrio sp. KM01]|uniref:hypothetical protein n=1 Tax=Bdellovibrio sp. KM01 TaxID=2748865 RepID=UPI0015EAC05D|nr:hypothetical protein [Bdellovibrio sp. KM01]QLY25081.1 hypothetical protein HW988_16925 [Bdellovibrio sp. KM01]
MKTIFCSLLASFVLSSVAQAEVSDLYNGVRCRTPDKAIQIHFAITKNQPIALYWIENDRVTVLSNRVEEFQQIAVGLDGDMKYVLNFDQGFYREIIQSTGRVTKDIRGLNCVYCPVEMDYCPGQFDNN